MCKPRLHSESARALAILVAGAALAFPGCLSLNNPHDDSATQAVTVAPGPPDMIVFGQQNFFGAMPNGANPAGPVFSFPDSIIKVGARYYVADAGNNRIVVFEGSLSSTPVVVLGQPNLTLGMYDYPSSLPTASNLSFPYQIASDGTHFAVADSNSRVLIWNTLPTRTLQPADVVLGQADFTGGLVNRGLAAPTAATMNYPDGVAFVGGKLLVADYGNNRILIWNSIPTVNGQPADAVVGQPSFTVNAANQGGAASTSTLSGPSYIDTDGTRIVVADYGNHRVLVWNSLANFMSAGADVYLGQSTPSGTASGNTLGNMYYPWEATFAGGALYVADAGNNRVLYWSSIPASGTAATDVIGQSGSGQVSANRGGGLVAAANTLSGPLAVLSDGTGLLVADGTNNRILDFAPAPASNTAAAAVVYGQTDFASTSANATPTNSVGMYYTAGFCVSDKYLIAIDQYNYRALVYDKNAAASGSPAIAVIGQPNFASVSANQGQASPSASSLGLSYSSRNCAVDESGRLYLSDPGNNRVLVFNQVPTTNNVAADYVLGQAGFTTTTANSGASGYGNLNVPLGVYAKSGKLFVADNGNNRVLIYNLPITQNRPLASAVVGQPDEVTVTAGTTRAKMSGPYGVYSDGARLFTAEAVSSRVLVFNAIPSANGASADIVLGEPDFVSSLFGVTPSLFGTVASSLTSVGLDIVDGFLFVPDPTNSRAPGFPVASLASGMPATKVLGAPNLTTVGGSPFNADGSAFGTLSGYPEQILTDPNGQYVWVMEAYNSRVIRIRRDAFWKYAN